MERLCFYPTGHCRYWLATVRDSMEESCMIFTVRWIWAYVNLLMVLFVLNFYQGEAGEENVNVQTVVIPMHLEASKTWTA